MVKQNKNRMLKSNHVLSIHLLGIQLGADRFKHINNCARNALEDCGFIKQNNNKSNTKSKRSKK